MWTLTKYLVILSIFIFILVGVIGIAAYLDANPNIIEGLPFADFDFAMIGAVVGVILGGLWALIQPDRIIG